MGRDSERPGTRETLGREREGPEARDAGRGGGGSRVPVASPLGTFPRLGVRARAGRGGAGRGWRRRLPSRARGPRVQPERESRGRTDRAAPAVLRAPLVKRPCFAAEGT